MKKIVLLTFVLVLLSVSMLGKRLVITVSGSTTHDVYPGESIQDAINLAQSGDTVFVHAGTYYEHVVVNKTVSLIGENRDNTIIDGSNTGTVANVTANNVTISGFTIRRSGSNYSLESPDCGIRVLFSNNNISHNTIKNNTYGIILGYQPLHSSANNFLSGNSISNNEDVGILIWVSNNNTIIGNDVSNNTNGIGLFWSGNNTITGNDVSSNEKSGIILTNNSSDNVIVGNIIANNHAPTAFDAGIYFFYSSGNLIFHNNIINNTRQTREIIDGGNSWDNGVEGNFWSDYDGTDADLDGIGDIPYHYEVYDNYPLMGVFSDFSVTHQEETYHVTTVCNSTISAFQFDDVNKVISFNVTGEDETLGFCRICIPKALMNYTSYNVLVDGAEPLMQKELPCSTSIYEYLYFTYLHSTHEVEIVPEFATWTSMLLLLIVLTVATVIYKRRLLKTPIH